MTPPVAPDTKREQSNRANDHAAPDSPRISVIVPVYEHWHYVPALLAHLADQTIPQSCFEVLLVDNGSTDFAPPAELQTNTRVHHCLKPGSYAARNRGVEQARGEWLVFTDADCRPGPVWLESLMQKADRGNGTPTMLAGPVDMVCDGTQPCAYEMYDLVRGIPQAWYVSRGYAATANLAVPAKLARSIGLFDDTRFSGADADFCRRANEIGVRLDYVPEAAVAHPARDSWADLTRKARRIKGGQLTAGSDRGRMISWLRTFLPPVIAVHRFMRQRDLPMRYRAVAVLVQFRIWGVEMREALRLLTKSTVERR